MDIKREFEIKDEPLEEVKYTDADGQMYAVTGLEGIQDGSCERGIGIKSEIKTEEEEEPLEIKMEDSKNEEIFGQISKVDERQLSFDSKEELLLPKNVKEESLKEEVESEKDFFKRLEKSKLPLVMLHKLSDKVLKDLYVEEGHKESDEKFKGEICSESQSQDLIEEERTNDKEECRCLNCNFLFEGEDELLSHLESSCKGKVTGSQCSTDNNFKSDLKTCLLNKKNADKSNEKGKLFKCSECSYESNQKGHLKRHILKHQSTKLFKCSDCNYKCNYKESLKYHILTHGNSKLFKCSECNYACNHKGSLKMHLITHGNIKLFKCSEWSATTHVIKRET